MDTSRTLTNENVPLVAIFLATTIFVAIGVLFFTRPVFAQNGDGAIAVRSIGVPAPEIAPNPGAFSTDGLAPAPKEPAPTESAPMYLPGSSADLATGPWMNQAMPPGPLLQPDMSDVPHGGFDGAIRP